ncbi:MAG: hypothetical protein AAGF77_06585 [Bacteroidota bacterium]
MRQLLVLLLFTIPLVAQQPYGIQLPGSNQETYNRCCSRMQTSFSDMPKEVSFGIQLEKGTQLYFYFNDKEWFTTIFQDLYDGIAVEVVERKQFECNQPLVATQIRGTLLKPLYSKNFKKGIQSMPNGIFRVKVGEISPKYQNKTLEFNMLFLGKRMLCRYQNTYNLRAYDYDLLDMGLYLDSITYNNTGLRDTIDIYEKKYKKLSFKIPFEKNKSTFLPEDIKPLYDSLKLTDFHIKKIVIQAFSSIEGSAERNKELQEKRSKSIVNALQSFQSPSIENEITLSENWVEFLADIEGTPHASLRALSKTAIKEAVDGSLAVTLEPYLKKHRKALITLYLDKIDRYQDLKASELVDKFNNSIVAEELDRAAQIQQSLFQKLNRKEANPDLLNQLVIPKQKRFVDFFNATSAFRYEMDRTQLLPVFYEFQELNKLAPDDKEVAYNLLVLKLRINHKFQGNPTEENLPEQIEKLGKLGISEHLIERMMINYHITLSERLMRKRDYDGKDRSVAYILKSYNNIPLSDFDYLSLAQYLSYYYDTSTAITLLEDRVAKIDVDAKLLFYYLNLTMVYDEMVERQDYRKIMLNAVNVDGERFCKLFDAANAGGVTFQLLANIYLKNTYCENCKP